MRNSLPHLGRRGCRAGLERVGRYRRFILLWFAGLAATKGAGCTFFVKPVCCYEADILENAKKQEPLTREHSDLPARQPNYIRPLFLRPFLRKDFKPCPNHPSCFRPTNRSPRRSPKAQREDRRRPRSRSQCTGNRLHSTRKPFWQCLGPGLITGAADDDPSGIGTYSVAGAQFDCLLLWLVPVCIPLVIAVQEMCGRVGRVTGKGLRCGTETALSEMGVVQFSADVHRSERDEYLCRLECHGGVSENADGRAS